MLRELSASAADDSDVWRRSALTRISIDGVVGMVCVFVHFMRLSSSRSGRHHGWCSSMDQSRFEERVVIRTEPNDEIGSIVGCC